MKRVICVFIALLAATGAFAAFNFTEFQAASDAFAGSVANSLPFNSSVGLNWSDAYIGQILDLPPHFGVGVTLGATTIPSAAVTQMLTALGITLPSSISQYLQYGVPLPAYTLEGRIGGFLLPFDIGVKFGYIPSGFVQSLGVPIDVNYVLAGVDLRFALVKEDLLLPDVSIGAGYTFMRGSVGISGLLGGAVDVGSFTIPGEATHTLSFTDPAVNFTWNTNVIDFKAQVSKTILFVRPYLGAGVSYGISSAGGGLYSSLLIDGVAPSAATIAQYNQLLQAAGQDVTLSDQGFLVQASASGWAVRAFGGVSLDLLVLKTDFTGMYNFTSGSFGGSLGLRLQL